MRFLLIDDHALFRAGLARILAEAYPDVALLTAGSLREGLACLAASPPDLVLLDLSLPDTADQHAVAAVSAVAPEVPVLVISMLDGSETVSAALRHGARGYLHKTEEETVMLGAIALVLAGGRTVPGWYERPPARVSDAPPPLSPRQRDVLALLERGLSNKEIARSLGIAEATVKIHVHNLLKALGTESRQKAAHLARQARL